MEQYTCIVCPNSCLITVDEKDGELYITGQQCRRGEMFARNEHTCPMRMFTSTMKINGAELSRISVISSGEIPKEMMRDCQKELSKTVLNAPVKLGDIVIKNICGTGIDIVASRTLNKAE